LHASAKLLKNRKLQREYEWQRIRLGGLGVTRFSKKRHLRRRKLVDPIIDGKEEYEILIENGLKNWQIDTFCLRLCGRIKIGIVSLPGQHHVPVEHFSSGERKRERIERE
jgi:hypothetical protein